MVKVKIDMTGWVMAEHGVLDSRLTVVRQTDDYIDPQGKHRARWLCKCSCGSDIVTLGINLRDGTTLSCGCLNKERVAENCRDRKKYNKYDLSGEYGVGWTSNTNREFYFELDRYNEIKDICWMESNLQQGTRCLVGYDAVTGKNILMHVLLGYRGYDHIDRNEFNNLENNLRKCTRQENSMNRSISKCNTSGIIGVSFSEKINRWRAYITINNKQIYLGKFIDKTEAIKARLQAEIKYFKDFAPQQHLYEQYGIVVQND